ncbi:MAG: hypothetical protein FWE32_12190 [Oscillospiraceae bacterium]|nr:hypothetical protein [Oscillospiraceae bacterium]
MGAKVHELEKRLEEIKYRANELGKKCNFTEEFYALSADKRILQRELSLAKGLETAVKLDYPYLWSAGAPLPHIVSNGYKTFLIYYIQENHPKWSAQEHDIADLNTGHDDITALVKFTRCYSYKFGGANDEALHGHPLFEHGLGAYEAYYVVNSLWIKAESKINSVHHCSLIIIPC